MLLLVVGLGAQVPCQKRPWQCRMPRTMVHPRLKRILSESSSAVSSPPDTASDPGQSLDATALMNMGSKHFQANPSENQRTQIPRSSLWHSRTERGRMQSKRPLLCPVMRVLSLRWTYLTRTLAERPNLANGTRLLLRMLTQHEALRNQEKVYGRARTNSPLALLCLYLPQKAAHHLPLPPQLFPEINRQIRLQN
jgi:hypothetical protein